jgi:hypothetical protein
MQMIRTGGPSSGQLAGPGPAAQHAPCSCDASLQRNGDLYVMSGATDVYKMSFAWAGPAFCQAMKHTFRTFRRVTS